jgi:hypothetical protein
MDVIPERVLPRDECLEELIGDLSATLLERGDLRRWIANRFRQIVERDRRPDSSRGARRRK